MDYSATEINLLGAPVTKIPNKLETDLYCKPTDTQQHLHAQSCHNNVFNPKMAGGQFDPPPCDFSKNVSSEERMKPWFFVTFNIILKHIFTENFIEFPPVDEEL